MRHGGTRRGWQAEHGHAASVSPEGDAQRYHDQDRQDEGLPALVERMRPVSCDSPRSPTGDCLDLLAIAKKDPPHAPQRTIGGSASLAHFDQPSGWWAACSALAAVRATPNLRRRPWERQGVDLSMCSTLMGGMRMVPAVVAPTRTHLRLELVGAPFGGMGRLRLASTIAQDDLWGGARIGRGGPRASSGTRRPRSALPRPSRLSGPIQCCAD
jgi:hypothetical protein